MGYLHDIEPGQPFVPRIVHRAVPGPVRRLWAREEFEGQLRLDWFPAVGGGRADGYRIHRTREGREYELLQETAETSFLLADPPPGEPWFYRVTAFNSRGAGDAHWVCFFQRGLRLRPRGEVLPGRRLLIPCRPGVRVEVCEFGQPPAGANQMGFVCSPLLP